MRWGVESLLCLGNSNFVGLGTAGGRPHKPMEARSVAGMWQLHRLAVKVQFVRPCAVPLCSNKSFLPTFAFPTDLRMAPCVPLLTTFALWRQMSARSAALRTRCGSHWHR